MFDGTRDASREERKLARHVTPSLTDAEISEQWRSIEERLDARRPAVLPWVAALAGLIVAATLVVAWLVPRDDRAAGTTASAWDGAVLESIQDDVSVSLGDGSKIELLPASKVVVREGSARAVHLDLRRGGARFDVTHVEGRAFDVAAAGVRVRVVGTRFSVTVADAPGGQRVTVSVERGAIEADMGESREPIRVRAGETWSVVRPRGDAPVTVNDARPSTYAAPAGSAPPPEEIAEAPADIAEPRVVRDPPGLPHHAATSPTPAAPTAQELFEKGNAARQGGDPGGAAAFYEALLRRYPGDARAGLSAFELGRLKMDQLGDARGAVSALQHAVALAPDSGFRQDALARLVHAYATLGDTTRCERAKEDYLGSYPGGVHASAVRAACAPKPRSPSP